MRPWESEPRQESLGGRTDSQDRMDRFRILGHRSEEKVNLAALPHESFSFPDLQSLNDAALTSPYLLVHAIVGIRAGAELI